LGLKDPQEKPDHKDPLAYQDLKEDRDLLAKRLRLLRSSIYG